MKTLQKSTERTSADVGPETLNLLVLGSIPSGLTSLRSLARGSGWHARRRRADSITRRGSGWHASPAFGLQKLQSHVVLSLVGSETRRISSKNTGPTSPRPTGQNLGFRQRVTSPKRFVYILKSLNVSAEYYVGVTSDPKADGADIIA